MFHSKVGSRQSDQKFEKNRPICYASAAASAAAPADAAYAAYAAYAGLPKNIKNLMSNGKKTNSLTNFIIFFRSSYFYTFNGHNCSLAANSEKNTF